MTNTNYLENICCPSCGQDERFMIRATVVVEVTDDDADFASSYYGNGLEWDDDSYCRCPDCDLEGSLATFRVGQEAETSEEPPG